jgi:hypothetical protein
MLQPEHEQLAKLYQMLDFTIRQLLRSCPDFKNWIRTQTQHAPMDCIHLSEQLWESRSPDIDGIWNVLRQAINDRLKLYQSICAFLAIRFGNTVRALVPITSPQYFQQNLFINPPNHLPVSLTKEETRYILHALTNLTYEMKAQPFPDNSPVDGLAIPVRGMLMASLTSNTPLYWGNVGCEAEKTFTFNTLDGQPHSFISVAREEEDVLGVMSAAYIPISTTEHGSDIILALYSPFAHIFGRADEPIPLNVTSISQTLNKIADVCKRDIQSYGLIDNLMGGNRPRLPLDYLLFFLQHHHKTHPPLWIAWMSDLIVNTPENLVLSQQEFVNHIIDALGMPIYPDSDSQLSFSSKLQNKQLMINFETDPLLAEGLLPGNFLVDPNGCLIDCTTSKTRHRDNTTRGAHLLATNCLAELLRNAHTKGKKGHQISLNVRIEHNCCSYTVSNPTSAPYKDALQAYWVVRQGHFPALHVASARRSGGLGLYLLRNYAQNADFSQQVSLTFPNSKVPNCHWGVQLDIPTPGESL